MAGFRFKQFDVQQDRCAMKVGTDGVLLGAWADGGRRILDIGSGTGLISLMMAQRFPEAEVLGIDIDPDACGQARENVAASPFAGRVKIECCALQGLTENVVRDAFADMEQNAFADMGQSAFADMEQSAFADMEQSAFADMEQNAFADMEQSAFAVDDGVNGEVENDAMAGGSSSLFDCIVSNPPFFVNSMKNPDSKRSLARHSDSLPFVELMRGVKRWLSEDGVFSAIVPTEVQEQFIAEAYCSGLSLIKKCGVKTVGRKQPKRYLLTFSKTRKGTVEDEVVVMTDNEGNRSPWYAKITEDFYL